MPLSPAGGEPEAGSSVCRGLRGSAAGGASGGFPRGEVWLRGLETRRPVRCLGAALAMGSDPKPGGNGFHRLKGLKESLKRMIKSEVK